MKKLFYYTSCLLLSLFTLWSCADNNKVKNNNEERTEVIFSSNMSLRVTGNNWNANDEIGVYMIPTGSGVEHAVTPANAKYIAQAEGASKSEFRGADASQKFFFTNSLTNADFIAYYPYSSTVNNFKIALNTEDQTQLSTIDYLYSDNLKNVDKSTLPLVLQFHHIMPLITFKFVDENHNPIDISQITKLSMSGCKTEGFLNLSNGNVEVSGSEKDILVNTNGSAIIIPQTVQTCKISFVAKGKKYTWSIGNRIFEKGKHYIFTARLVGASVDISGEIIDREEGGNSEGNVTPEDESKDFSLDNESPEMPANENTLVLNVTTNASTYSAVSDAGWLTVTSNVSDKTITLKAEENNSNEKRSTQVTISYEKSTTSSLLRSTETKVITVVQLGKQSSAPENSDLMITVYCEGPSFEKYVKVYNPTNQTIDFSKNEYKIEMINFGKKGTETGRQTYLFNGVLDAKKSIVLHHGKATVITEEDLPGVLMVLNNTFCNFNGNDPIELLKDGEVIDRFGEILPDMTSMLWKDQIFYRNVDVQKPSSSFAETEWKSTKYGSAEKGSQEIKEYLKNILLNR